MMFIYGHMNGEFISLSLMYSLNQTDYSMVVGEYRVDVHIDVTRRLIPDVYRYSIGRKISGSYAYKVGTASLGYSYLETTDNKLLNAHLDRLSRLSDHGKIYTTIDTEGPVNINPCKNIRIGLSMRTGEYIGYECGCHVGTESYRRWCLSRSAAANGDCLYSTACSFHPQSFMSLSEASPGCSDLMGQIPKIGEHMLISLEASNQSARDMFDQFIPGFNGTCKVVPLGEECYPGDRYYYRNPPYTKIFIDDAKYSLDGGTTYRTLVTGMSWIKYRLDAWAASRSFSPTPIYRTGPGDISISVYGDSLINQTSYHLDIPSFISINSTHMMEGDGIPHGMFQIPDKELTDEDIGDIVSRIFQQDGLPDTAIPYPLMKITLEIPLNKTLLPTMGFTGTTIQSHPMKHGSNMIVAAVASVVGLITLLVSWRLYRWCTREEVAVVDKFYDLEIENLSSQ
jgi:hypothetical protein